MTSSTARARLAPQDQRLDIAAGRSPFTYVFLVIVALLSLFPLYWSLVVASHDNSAVSAYPPVLTPGTQLFHNISRLFNSGEVNVDFWGAMVNSFIVAVGRHGLGRALQRARRVRVRQARLPRREGADGRDRDHDDGAGPARGDPAVHRDDPLRLGQQPQGGDRAEPRHRVRRLPDAPVHPPGGAERDDRRRARRRVPHAADLLARDPAGGAAGGGGARRCSRSRRPGTTSSGR